MTVPLLLKLAAKHWEKKHKMVTVEAGALVI